MTGDVPIRPAVGAGRLLFRVPNAGEWEGMSAIDTGPARRPAHDSAPGMNTLARGGQRESLRASAPGPGKRSYRHLLGRAMISTGCSTEWRTLGACRSADPDLFFPISSAGPARGQIAQAKAVCARCQVRRECLSFALKNHQVDGVWGGTSAEERQSLMRRPRPLAAGHAA